MTLNHSDLIISDLSTGYFADPMDPAAEFPPVHAVIADETEPLCGEAVPEGHEYQWCSGTLWMPYVDCKKCQTEVHEIAVRQGLLREDRAPRTLRQRG